MSSLPSGLGAKSVPIQSLWVGEIRELWPGKAPSAIAKRRVDRRLEVGLVGFVDDAQADLSVHGGVDKAIHHYAAEHYAVWREEFPSSAERLVPGGFGENVSTTGISEADLCIGDVLSLGSARVQVSQGRQPCWKLNQHTGLKTLAKRFQQTGHTGWYYRVVEGGRVEADDAMAVLERPCPDWPLRAVVAALGDAKAPSEVWHALATLPELAESWRQEFRKRIQAGS